MFKPKYSSVGARIIDCSVLADEPCADGTYCWLWTKSTGNSGYGRFDVRRDGRVVHVQAHRASFEAFVGRPLRDHHVVRHACDEPLCVNPQHLKRGTQRQNVRDMIARGRHRNGRTKREDAP